MADISKKEIAHLIRSFVDGSCGPWDWDDFTSVKQSDPEIEKIRLRLCSIRDDYPSDRPKQWCNEEGRKLLLEIANELLQ